MTETRTFYVQTAHRLASYIEQELPVSRNFHFRFTKAVPSYKVLTMWLSINPSYTKRIMAMTKEMSQACLLEKGSFIRAEWGSRGTVELQIPKPKDLWTAPKVDKLPLQFGVKTAVGLDTQNQAAMADFANPLTAHALIAGLTGCGKTNLQRLLVYLLALQNKPDEVRFLLFDVADTGESWEGFEQLPHLYHGVISDRQTALEGMEWLRGEMERRAEVKEITPRLFAFIDEIQVLAQDQGFVDPIEELAQRGRKRGISLVLATQRPVKESVGSMNVKALMGLRVVGRVTSAQEAYLVTDLPESGAELLLKTPGDMLLVKPGAVQRVATPLVTARDLSNLPTNGRGGRVDFPKMGSEEEAEPGGPGRPPDAIEPEQVAYALINPDRSQRDLVDNLHMGFPKAKRVLAWAAKLRQALDRLGFCVVPKAWARKQLGIS